MSFQLARLRFLFTLALVPLSRLMMVEGCLPNREHVFRGTLRTYLTLAPAEDRAEHPVRAVSYPRCDRAAWAIRIAAAFRLIGQ